MNDEHRSPAPACNRLLARLKFTQIKFDRARRQPMLMRPAPSDRPSETRRLMFPPPLLRPASLGAVSREDRLLAIDPCQVRTLPDVYHFKMFAREISR